MKILICAATGFEAQACREGISAMHGSGLFTILQTGMGLARARKALIRWLDSNSKPDLIISTGFAGTIDAELPLGSWVYATEVHEWLDGHKPQLQQPIKPFAGTFPIAPKLVSCRLVSAESLVDYKVAVPVLQQELGPGTAIAVDMETAALAAVATRYRIRFMALRMLTDSPLESLPGFVYEFSRALGPDLSGTISLPDRVWSLGRGTTRVLAQPVSVLTLLRNSLRWRRELQSGWRQFVTAFVHPHYEASFGPEGSL